jgi:hypothetical protein
LTTTPTFLGAGFCSSLGVTVRFLKTLWFNSLYSVSFMIKIMTPPSIQNRVPWSIVSESGACQEHGAQSYHFRFCTRNCVASPVGCCQIFFLYAKVSSFIKLDRSSLLYWGLCFMWFLLLLFLTYHHRLHPLRARAFSWLLDKIKKHYTLFTLVYCPFLFFAIFLLFSYWLISMVGCCSIHTSPQNGLLILCLRLYLRLYHSSSLP